MIIQIVWASPKSLYLVANHHTRQFDAWEIKPDGTAIYQATYWLSYATDPAGIAIDESSNTLFITSEFSGGVELVDATMMTSIGVSSGPSDLAGIDVDNAYDIVYTVKRYSNNLYVFDWNPNAKSLTPRPGFNPYYLPGSSGAFGIALDEIRGVLWVADSAAGAVRAYDVNTWVEDTGMSFTPSHKPVDVAVDRMRGYVYTVSMSAAAWVPPGCGSRLLSKYDIRTRTEVTGSLPDQGVGVAVDEVTGFVYVTLSPYGRGLSQGDLSVWDTSTTPWTQVQIVKVSGSPAGICIPQEEVAYNPLGLSKEDGLAEGEYVNPGDDISYKIYYDNIKNAYDVHNVKIVDKLPAEVSFVSATASGTYDPSTHTVTWDIGTLPAGATQQYVQLVVRVSSTVSPSSMITNYVSIDSDETPPTTVSEVTDVSSLPGEIGLIVDVIPDKDSCNKNDDIKFDVTVTNPTDATGVNVDAYYVKLGVIEPEEIDIDVPAGGVSIAKISPGGSKTTTFYGKAIKGGDNVEVIVNAWGYTDLTEEAGKIRGRGSCTITVHDPETPKPNWSFAIITDLHIGYNSPRWDSDNDGYIVGEIDYASAGWDDAGPYDPETLKRLDYEVTRNLENAADKIITEMGPYNIKFVVILGDISDTAEKSEFLKAREILNRLNDPNEDGNTEDGIPYIPLFGNHDTWPYAQDVGTADDRDHYSSICSRADGDKFFREIFWGESNKKNIQLIKNLFGVSWEYPYDEVFHVKGGWGEGCIYTFEEQCSKGNKYYDNGVFNRECISKEHYFYLQNYGFTFDGITFVCLDFVARLGEDFNPFNDNALPGILEPVGGVLGTKHRKTMDFARDYIEKHKATEKKTIVFFSHHPMFSFPITSISGYKIYNFFGHVHVSFDFHGDPKVLLAGLAYHIGVIDPKLNEYYWVATEDTGRLDLSWIRKTFVDHLKGVSVERNGKCIRIVQITDEGLNFSVRLKPKAIEIKWPFPDFAYSYASYPEPNKEVAFDAQFTTYYGFRTSFDWNFGDGSYGLGLSVVHTYTQEGWYNVTLTATTKNLVTGEEKIYTVTRFIYVHRKHAISSLPLNLNVVSLLTGEDLTRISKNTYEFALITKKGSEDISISLLGVHFEEASEDINLSTLVADVDLEGGKSVIYTPSWPEEIDHYKALFIPSTGAGTVYICLGAKSLNEVSLQNADLIINVGETKDNITVTTTLCNGREYYLVLGMTGTGGGELKDTIPPTTILTIGEPKYVTDTIYVTPDTPFALTATDNPGGTGIALTAYKIRNATYDSGWLPYAEPFYLTGLADGVYSIDYNSTDNANNVESTNAINVTLFSWDYVFTDSYGRETTLKINIEHHFFQFITPDNDYGIRNATYMRRCGRAIIIKHYDNELRLITVAVDTKLDFCVAIAWDVQTGKRYFLIDKAGTE
jgi:uncharacterized repeat protein (TIGR01451 family)